MNRNFIRVLFAAAASMLAAAGCESSSSVLTDEPLPADTTLMADTTTTIDDDVFTPPTGPIEPLTDYLRPIMTDGKRWKGMSYTAETGSQSEQIHYIYTGIDGDTIVDGKAAKKLWTLDSDWNISADNATGPEVIRETDGKIYRWYPSRYADEKDWWALTYNVNARGGDSIISTVAAYPLSRGTITLMNKTRRAVKVWVPFDNYQSKVQKKIKYDYWVEGIGMLFPHFPNYVIGLGTTVPFGPEYMQLLECWDGDEKIYDYREFKEELYQPLEIFAHETDWPYWYEEVFGNQDQ